MTLLLTKVKKKREETKKKEEEGYQSTQMMKFQRRILPPHSPTYLEMEEYITPPAIQPSISCAGSTSDLSEIESVCSLSANVRQRSDSLTNLFNMSEDSASLSNFSIASYSLSQTSYDNGSPTTCTTISPQPTSLNLSTEKSSRSRRSLCSSTTSSQKNFSMKPTETVLNSRDIHSSSLSDKCGLIANDGNNIGNLDDQPTQSDDEQSQDENDLDILPTQTNRGLRKTVLNNVDRLLNSANKQMKLQ